MVFNFSRQPVGEHIAKAYCILTIELSVLDQVLELGKCLHEGIRKQIASFLLPGSRSTLGIILPQPLLFSQFLGSGRGGARCGEGGLRPACVVIGSEVCLTSWFHRDPLTAFLAFLTLPNHCTLGMWEKELTWVTPSLRSLHCGVCTGVQVWSLK